MNQPSPILSIDLERLRPRLHRYCTRMVGSVLDAEDIVQDALVRALESQDRPTDNPEGWLFRIAHNLALDLLRRRARAPDMRDEDVDLIEEAHDEQARREATSASLPAFMRLPPAQRSAVILFDVLDYSADEVGDILGTTVPAVKSALQRGRGRLRDLAGQLDDAGRRAALPDAERRLLQRYVDLFNARDFDMLREMLAADVRLDLVNRLRLQGGAVGEYFTRYGQSQGWTAWPGLVEGRPAVLIRQPGGIEARPDYFVVLGWADGQVSSIRDFLFARYAMADAAYVSLST